MNNNNEVRIYEEDTTPNDKKSNSEFGLKLSHDSHQFSHDDGSPIVKKYRNSVSPMYFFI